MTLEDRMLVRMPHQDREGQGEAARGLVLVVHPQFCACVRGVTRRPRPVSTGGGAQRCVISWASV
eukprot:4823483-Prymnesium_polylepis.1